MKENKIIALLLCVALICTAMLTGCGGSSSDDKSGTEKTGGGILKVASPQGSATLDPVNGYDYWYLVRYGVCETLMGFNEDMTPFCWLAESYETEDDKLTWHFTIRDNVTFSNGNKLTAEIAKGCIEHAYKDSVSAASYFEYDSIDADGQVLTIKTKNPVPTMAYILADPVFIMYDCTQDLSKAADEGVIGTGPFVITSFDPITGSCTVEKNENYWNGDVNLDGIEFSVNSDTTAIAMSLENNEVDAVYSVAYTDIDRFEGNDNFTVESVPGGRTDFCYLNQNGPLGDESLRQAVARALDKEGYCTSLLNNQFVPGSTPLSSALPYGYDELTDINKFDVDSANKILDDAGYEDKNGDGFREDPDGNELVLEIVSYNSRAEIPTMAQAIQLNLKDIGVNTKLTEVDQSTAWNRFLAGEYDMLLMSVSMTSSGDPQSGLASYFTTKSEDNQNNNSFGYSSKKVDSLMEELKQEFDLDKRAEIIKAIEQQIMDDTAVISLCYPKLNFVTKSGVSGVTCHESDYYWVSKDTAVN